jgi:hypothetical protein
MAFLLAIIDRLSSLPFHAGMSNPEKIDFEKLLELGQRTASATRACACSTTPFIGWESLPLSFPASQLQEVGTLRGDAYDEPSFAEFHPAGTTYWSKDAPIAMRHYPYNRCSVWTCKECGRCFLRYTEAGGYYVEQRIRTLIPELIVDAAL